MSDEQFARAVLARTVIGHSHTVAEKELTALGLTCSEAVVKAIPGTATNGQSRERQCSRPPPPQEQCVQRIEIQSVKDRIVRIALSFEQLPGSVDGSACGR